MMLGGERFTRVDKCGVLKPLFGHDQPKLPTSLGYYDLKFLKSRTSKWLRVY
jgi:hypothetical protein